MPDQPDTTPEKPAEEPKAQQQGDPAAAAELGEGGKKALDAERAARKAAEKAAADLQTKLNEINQANETALEKAQREATEAREAANQATVDALRFRIAAETGITDNVDLILTAADEETMRRQATLWGSRQSDTPAGPRPDLTQGGSGTPPALNSDGLEDALRSKLGIA